MYPHVANLGSSFFGMYVLVKLIFTDIVFTLVTSCKHRVRKSMEFQLAAGAQHVLNPHCVSTLIGNQLLFGFRVPISQSNLSR